MTIVDKSKSSHNITASKVLITTGLCCVPIISETGELLHNTFKNYKVDKIPVKDSFVKAIKQSGEKAQTWFSSLKKYSPLKVGIAHTALWTIVDVLLTYWCVDKISEKIKKKKETQQI